MKDYSTERNLLSSCSHCRLAGRDEKADLLLLHLINNQRSIPILVVDQASASQPVNLLMFQFLGRTREAEIERHFPGEPCSDHAGQIRLDFKGKTAVKKAAVCRSRGFHVAVGSSGREEVSSSASETFELRRRLRIWEGFC